MLYAITIALSALLLFAIEPMTVKHLLPWFGGSSEVWATGLLFFTSMLFVGYSYVYLLSTRPLRVQPMIHLFVIAIAVCASLFSLYQWHSIYPPLDWTIGNTASPAINVLRALLFAIGAPFFLLATTGPLLQYWYGISTRKEPYIFYALSNAGSLVALLGFVFIAEPYSTLHTQESVWFALFLAYITIHIAILVRFYKGAATYAAKSLHTHQDASVSTPLRTQLAWVGYGALPAFMLVATTVVITQAIAPVPFLWIVPLVLYLLTFILAFTFGGIGRSIFVPLLLLGGAAWAYVCIGAGPSRLLEATLSGLALLFLCGLCCHGQLYRLRPVNAGLPLFYLFLSLGGVIGTLCASILAPLVFTDFWEFPLGVAISACVAVYLLSEQFFPRILDVRKILLAKVLFVVVVVYLFVSILSNDNGFASVYSRNFYGNVQVQFRNEGTILMHGTTLHGIQSTDAKERYLPVTYYTPASGIGRAVAFERVARKNKGMRVGVIGLGTGTMAAYCRAGDALVFYEIDPQVVAVSGKYFSYLSHCAGSEVRLGDGRILLEQERRTDNLGKYDLFVIDAFSDDTIPVHLLTLQSVALYAAHLRSADSIIAVHVSNRYLDLAPVVLRLAAQSGFSATVITDDGHASPIGAGSKWVILAKNPVAFRSAVFADAHSSIPKASTSVWTDDYTSLISVFRPSVAF